MVTQGTIRRRVNRGARLLDSAAPQWFLNVDTETLDIQDYRKCILGQVYGGYSDGVNNFPLYGVQREHHGFTVNFTNDMDVDKLNATWKRLILARRKAQ